jgi:predicted DNA-binding transcriptional regulator YafY
MRADRLLSIMLLLQTRDRLTAQELARELEVSERTIYRDMIALSTAGVPVYGTSGPEGGFSLVESYRTSLTGLSEGEVRALFMLSIPAPLGDLGLTGELKAAMRKLAAALPSSSRGAEERVRQRIFLDSNWWHQDQENIPHLQTLYQAIWGDHQISLKYRPHPLAEVDLVVDPYGLVAKAGVWYLVSHRNLQIHVHRVAGLSEVHLLETNFNRPQGFDLQEFWKGWCLARENQLTDFAVTVRVHQDFIPWLPMFFGSRIRERLSQSPSPDDQGRIILDLFFESLEAARERLLGCGGGLEVLAPRALRFSIQDYARQILQQYSNLDP